MAYMHVGLSVSEHGTGFPANVLAQEYGSHIMNVKLATDTDNGMIVGVDTSEQVSFDVFNETTPTTLTGTVLQQNQDGSWLVIVETAVNAGFVYQKPLTPYESPKELLDEKAMFNKAGDIVRVYMLQPFDRISVSEDNFNGTPAAKAKITGVSNKKMTIGS